MPVAIRKRSWEEHVTHPSGLQYSYDDLDLVCCHGVDSEGSWMESGASKQGRRMRCASMPEGCHRVPTSEDEARTLEPTTFEVNDDKDSGQLLKNNVNVPVDLKEDSLHDISREASKSEHLQTTNVGNSGEIHCSSNSGMSCANISLTTDCKNNMGVEGEVGTGVSQSCDAGNDNGVYKSPHISCEEQQCISISCNNGPLLSKSAGEQHGKLPNYQETKESHVEDDCRSPEISGTAQNWSSAAELEPQTDLPDVKEQTFSTSGLVDTSVTLPTSLLDNSVNMMESDGVMSLANTTVQPVVNVAPEEVSEKVANDSWSTDSAEKLDPLNDPETPNGNTGLQRGSRDIQERDLLDATYNCEISCQELPRQCEIETTAQVGHQEGQSVQAECTEKAVKDRNGSIKPSDICVKGQCCLLTVENVSSTKPDNINIEGSPVQAISQPPETDKQSTTSLNESSENTDEISVSKELACCEDQVVAQQLENSCSKLDTILEVSHVEPDDTPALSPRENSDFSQNPDAQHLQMSDNSSATEQHPENLPPNSAEVSEELSPEGHHGNQEASGCCFGESPASEVADGQREHHHSPETAVSRMEESDEEGQAVILSDTQLSSPVLNGTNEPGDQKVDVVVRVRMRKREHACLDSMVLLLMKLDQLDQEIENALSATSSMDSTPTLHRHQLQELDEGSVPAASQNHPNSPAASTSGPTPAHGTKPKSGSTSTVPENTRAEIEAKEACTWLRAAGFPQYAQLYEDAGPRWLQLR